MKILAIGPHTDDIELGCGGTLARYSAAGAKISYLAFSTGHGNVEDRIRAECYAAASLIKPVRFAVHNFSGRFLSVSRQTILNILVQEERDFKPDVVIGPNSADIHQDHSAVAAEVFRAFKRCSIISYLLPWNGNWTAFGTNIFIRLSKDDIDTKLAMLRKYRSQAHRPYMKRIVTLSYLRHAGFIAHCEFAEEFMVQKVIL